MIAAKPAKLLPSPSAVFPLHVSASKRYLVDSRGRPFLIMGDSPQSLIVNLSTRAASSYFADRERDGFNSVWINLLCDAYTGGRSDGTTYDGIAPFTTRGTCRRRIPPTSRVPSRWSASPPSTIWRCSWTRSRPVGGLTCWRATASAKAYAYGQYLGQLFRRFPNITGSMATISRPGPTPVTMLSYWPSPRASGPPIPKRCKRSSSTYLVSTSLDDPSWTGIIGLNAAYTYYPTYARGAEGIPTISATMSGLHDRGQLRGRELATPGPETLRRQEYWTMLSGATGQFYGNKYIWQFCPRGPTPRHAWVPGR